VDEMEEVRTDDRNEASLKNNGIFDENFRYYCSIGYDPCYAKRKAIDYFRRFTSREVLEDFEKFSEHEDKETISQEDLIIFNSLIKKVSKSFSKKDGRLRTLLFCHIRKENLDCFLDQENLKEMLEEVPENIDFKTSNSIAEYLGYKKSSSNKHCRSYPRIMKSFQTHLKTFEFVHS
jgi:hypothetical protein